MLLCVLQYNAEVNRKGLLGHRKRLGFALRTRGFKQKDVIKFEFCGEWIGVGRGGGKGTRKGALH
jgi:hypothetical protein